MTPISPAQTMSDILKGLQALLDYVPAQAREDLEGEKPQLQGTMGEVESMREARDILNIALYERQFTDDQRKALAAKGHALPDGSFPIETKEDLANAKSAYGRKPTPAVKAHINKRAKDLGEEPMGESAKLEEAGDCSMSDDAFGNLSPSQQKSHLTGTHGVADDHPDMQVPSKRLALHSAQKESFWTETIGDEFIPLLEGGGANGLKEIKIIKPGWGSSGYYRPEILERDGPVAFPKGTKMFWDHPMPQEEGARPERSLRDLAAELVTTPKYLENHAKGPGLYAMAKPFSKYSEAITELAPHIGVSIRAMGRGTMGTAEGRQGKIIEEIKRGQSIDFVTVPGAGGEILESFREAAQTTEITTPKETTKVSEQQLKEAADKLRERDEEIAQLRKQLRGDEARQYVASQLGKLTEGLRPAVIAKLTEQLSASPVLDDDGDLDKAEYTKAIKEAVKAERAYLLEVMGDQSGRVTGLGGSAGDDIFSESGKKVDTEELAKRDEESFRMLGLSESIAKQAAIGRR